MSNINYNDCSNILNYSIDIQQKYAYKFAEGSEDLYNLLLTLWNKYIYTLGCCSGHKDNDNAYFSYMLTNEEGRILASYIISLINEYSDLELKCYILGPHPKTGYLEFSFIFPKSQTNFIIKKILNFLDNIDYSLGNNLELFCAFEILLSKKFKYFTIEIDGIDNKTITVVDDNMDSSKHKYFLNEVSRKITGEVKTK